MLRYFKRNLPSRLLWTAVLVLGTWSVAFYLHPPVKLSMTYETALYHDALGSLPLLSLIAMEAILLIACAFFLRAIVERLVGGGSQGYMYILVACLIGGLFLPAGENLLMPLSGFLLVLYSLYALLFPMGTSHLGSRIFRASFFLSVAGTLYLPYLALVLIPLLIPIYRSILKGSSVILWLSGLLLPQLMVISTRYVLGIPPLEYLPDWQSVQFALTGLSCWYKESKGTMGYWAYLLLMWLCLLPNSRHAQGEHRNTYMLGRLLVHFSIVCLLIAALFTDFSKGIFAPLGILLALPLVRLFYTRDRSWMIRILFALTVLGAIAVTIL